MFLGPGPGHMQCRISEEPQDLGWGAEMRTQPQGVFLCSFQTLRQLTVCVVGIHVLLDPSWETGMVGFVHVAAKPLKGCVLYTSSLLPYT